MSEWELKNGKRVSTLVNGKCQACGNTIHLGHAAIYNADDGTVTCLGCEGKAPKRAVKATELAKAREALQRIVDEGCSKGCRTEQECDCAVSIARQALA